MLIYVFILVLTLRNASKAPFSMYSITIMTGFPERKDRFCLRNCYTNGVPFFDKTHVIPLKDWIIETTNISEASSAVTEF